MKALALSLLILSAIVVAKAEGLRAAIEASNKKIHKAMMAKDFVALDKMFKAGMTKDFKYTEAGKTQTYAQMMAGMKMGLSQMSNITASTKILSLKESANTGTCTALHTMGGTMIGQDKKKHTTKFTGTAVETYRKVGGQWKMASMDWKATSMMMDGKAMPMAAGG